MTGGKPLPTESLVFPLASRRTSMLQSTQPGPPKRRKRLATLDRTHASTLKRKEDTANGCRDLAAVSLAQVVLTATLNERRRFEHSADMWAARADLLDRMELRSITARTASLSLLDEPSLSHSGEARS
jgi:hypothetical protein